MIWCFHLNEPTHLEVDLGCRTRDLGEEVLVRARIFLPFGRGGESGNDDGVRDVSEEWECVDVRHEKLQRSRFRVRDAST